MSLNLAMNDITGTIPSTNFQQMSALENLDLSSNRLTGPIPSEIGTFVKLESLNLYDNGKDTVYSRGGLHGKIFASVFRCCFVYRMKNES